MTVTLGYLSTFILLLTACTPPAERIDPPRPTPTTQITLSTTVPEQPTAVPSPTPQPTMTNTPVPTETAVPTITPTDIPPPATELHNNKPILYYDAADGHYYRIGLNGGPPDLLTQQPDSGHIMPDMVEQSLRHFNTPTVSPDGRYLLQYDGYNSWQLLSVPDRTVIASDTPDLFYSPTWSPDSQQFAYLKDEHELCVFDLATVSEQCLWGSDSRLFAADWSPDGRFIAVAQDDETDSMGLGQIWLIKPTTGDTFRAEAFQGSPEIALGSIFTWLSNGEALLIYNLPEDGSALYVLEEAQTIRFPNRVWSLSPDGRFFYTSDGFLIDGTNTYQLTDPTACRSGILGRQNAWSPDSRRFAFVTACSDGDNFEGEWTLSVIDLVTGERLGVRTLPQNFGLLDWATDENTLLLSHKTSGWPRDTDIYTLSLNGSSKPQLIVSGAIFLGSFPQWLAEE